VSVFKIDTPRHTDRTVLRLGEDRPTESYRATLGIYPSFVYSRPD